MIPEAVFKGGRIVSKIWGHISYLKVLVLTIIEFCISIFMLVDTFFNFETFMPVELYASRYSAVL